MIELYIHFDTAWAAALVKGLAVAAASVIKAREIVFVVTRQNVEVFQAYSCDDFGETQDSLQEIVGDSEHHFAHNDA